MSASDVSVYSILCGRYQDILKGADLKSLAVYLAKGGIISDGSLQRILASSENQRDMFSQVLAEKGSTSLVECRIAIDKFKLGVQATSTEFTNVEFPVTKLGKGDERQLNTTEERRVVSSRSSTDVQCVSKSPVDSSISVIKFAALFSALLHRITEALYCGNFEWLVVDIPLDHVTSYLPDEHQRKEGVDSQISLGNLLEAFRDLYKGKEALWGQVKRKGSNSLPPVINSSKEDAELQLERTSLTLKRSEERNLQLVKVTQEWSEECKEKDLMVSQLQKQLRGVERERDTLLAKYTRAKQILGSGGGGGGRGGDGGDRELEKQFEEMRTELYERKDVHDKLMEERDDIIATLKAELYAAKQVATELRDKLANYTVQAHIKEPTSREMALLLEENRRLKDSLCQLQGDNERLNRAVGEARDELLAARLNLEELQQLQKTGAEKPPKASACGRDRAKEQYHKHPKPVPRTQAMVTGYTHRVIPHPVATITARSSDDDHPSTEHIDGSGSHIVTHPPSPNPRAYSTSPTSPLSPSSQPTFPRSRSPHNLPPSKPHSSLEVPVSRPIQRKEDEQNRMPAPQAAVVMETERKCPSCQHTFYTLGEREFQSHVAGCFK